MFKIKLFLATVSVFFACMFANAQNIRVTGIVSDESSDEAVTGAAVQLKGSSTVYTLTSETGEYSLTVPSDGVLLVSCLGYESAEIPVNGKVVVNIVLTPDTQRLDDVIVVAYGSTRKEAVTGSVTSVSNDKFSSAPVTSVDKALSGKLAGVQITSVSGQPGASSQIRIRGNSSINASNNPLWVVDGIAIVSSGTSEMTNTSNSIATLNPNDIESITVLKDAAAAAVYGSRAANGVILITTKSGKAGKAQFDVRAKYGISWLQSDTGYGVMTGEELLSFQRDAIVNAGMDPDDPNGTYYRPLSLLDNANTDWMDVMTRLGQLQEYEISARGGNNRGTYFSSFSYHKNEGVFYGIDFEKIQGRVNADYKLTDKLETGVRVNVAYTEQNDVPMQSLYYANPLFAGMTIVPWISAWNEDGTPNVEIPGNSYVNPRANAIYDDQWSHSYRFNGTMFLKYNITKNIVAETRNSAELAFTEDRRFWDPKSMGNGGQTATVQQTDNRILNLTTSNTVNYTNTFGGYHNLRVLVGQEANKYKYQYYYIYAPGVDEAIPYPNTASQSSVEAENGFSNETLLSFFGIADYNYDNRYFLQATVREDGSSLFGKNNKWGTFWSVSGSWNASSEKFFERYKHAVSLLKLRASYGVNGNNGISAYQAYGLYSSSQYNGVVGWVPSSPANDDLSWELNKTWNVGLDLAFMDNKFRTNIDVYQRKTCDMLLDVEVPATTGFTSNFMNIGSMRNSGVEIQFEADIINNSNLLWSAGFNIAHNKTKILDLGGEDEIASSSYLYYIVGKSMYTYRLKDYYGVNPSNGEALYVTEDGTLTNSYSKAREYDAGSPEPKFIGGFNTQVQWKGFQLSAFFEFKTGCDIFLCSENRYVQADGNQMNMNQAKSALNYWKNPGDTGVNPKPVAGNSSYSYYFYTDRWLENGSYLRLKDVTLSYNLPQSVLDMIHLKSVRVYVSGLNLYCFNDVNYWDPEQGVTGSGAGKYPLTKSVVAGIEVSF